LIRSDMLIFNAVEHDEAFIVVLKYHQCAVYQCENINIIIDGISPQ